ncbi:MAG: PQQ-binding-like beta-propeller repeat protein [Opitutaceae bacterium]|nr:PQQ-binding-like beta-propeller repeat protein [Opitutaceae bacterium]
MNFSPRLPALVAFTLVAFFPPAARAAGLSSWPEWRGTTGQGVAPGATPPTMWGDEKNIRWKAKIGGLGFSTPIIWKDRVFLLTAVETAETPAGATAAAPTPPAPAPAPGGGGEGRGKGGKRGPGGFGGGGRPTKVVEFTVVALDRATGKTVWSKVARREVPHEGKHQTNSFASASPLTDGEHLYVSFGSRGLFCYDLQGILKWEKDLGDMQTRNGFGEGSSPALAGDFLIVPWDQETGSFIVALNKKTGAEVWRQARDERTSWATPLIVPVAGKQQAVLPATKRTRSYDVATGEMIWEASGLGTNVIPTPVTGHGMVYVTSGFQGFYIQAIKLTARGDVSTGPDMVWQQRKGTPYVASPVLSGDRIFVTKEREAFLSCLNALTGEFHFVDQPLEGMRGGIYASPLAANGHLYVVGREGLTYVLKDTTKFEVVARNTLSERIDASPVAVDKELYLRGHEHLYCIAER